MDIPLKALDNGFDLPVYGFGANKIGGGSTAEDNPDIDRTNQT